MANTAANPGDLHPLVVKHPWRPYAYVVADGMEGRVQVGTTTGEVASLVDPVLRGVRAVAVNPRLPGWRSEETVVACGLSQGVAVARVGPDGGSRVDAQVGGADWWACSALMWNPAHPNTQLAASFYTQHAYTHLPPHASGCGNAFAYVKVYDVQAGACETTMSLVRECSSVGSTETAVEGYSVCWTEPGVLLASTSEGMPLIDLRQQGVHIAAQHDAAPPLVHLTRSLVDRHYVVGVEQAGAGSVVHLFDMRKAGHGAVGSARARCCVSGLAWREDSSWFMTSSTGDSVVELWDSHELATLGPTTVDGPCPAGGDTASEMPVIRVTSTTSSLPSPPSKPLPAVRGREEHKVGCPVLAAAWAAHAPAAHTIRNSHFDAYPSGLSSLGASTVAVSVSHGPPHHARPELDLVLLTEALELCSNRSVCQRKCAMTQYGMVGFVAGETAAQPVLVDAPVYEDDVSTAMQLREEVGFGASRLGSYLAAVKFQDRELLQWAQYTWLMRRAFERNSSVAFPGVAALLRRDDLTLDTFKETEEERKETAKARTTSTHLALEDEVEATHTQRGALAAEPPTDLPCTGHHAVLQKQFKTYDSPARECVKALCGWEEGVLPVASSLLHGVMGDEVQRFERHVAFKILNLQLSEAEHMLRNSPTYFRSPERNTKGSTYSLLAFAIGALTLDSSIGWRDTIASLAHTDLSVYLTSALQFLSCWQLGSTASDEPWAMYAPILECRELDPLHRVGFACRYLNDAALGQYLTHLQKEPLPAMSRLLLGGASEATLADFLDDTGDIQVTAFTAVVFLKATAESTQRWTTHYRDYLAAISDFARCRTEVVLAGMRKKEQSTVVPPPGGFGGGMQTYNAMMYRGGMGMGMGMRRPGGVDPKKLATRVQKSMSQAGGPPGAPSASRDEKKETRMQVICQDCRQNYDLQRATSSSGGAVSVCPYCSAPAPKCSVCVQVLGAGNDPSFPVQNFTWCLTCKHGGHVGHLLEWFAEHKSCPVAGCNCECMSLDVVP
eukprot:TRINITY_DN11422_c0_g1_i1.p1 TRINITY_DN11422_c0_g1~~TRINITY_DN11422_c0_g1_i1.p1  ORF type:complete len:1050 (+),score=326.20 TRINITY_DN11422_c0_g1_i1:116-3151(+)